MQEKEKVVREILAELEKTGTRVEFVSDKGRHGHKIRVYVLGTTQDFPVPSKIRAGHAKKNFYSQMRRRINERIMQVKARQSLPA